METTVRQRMSPEGRAMLRKLEGSRASAYRDVAGFWTIGVGHKLTRDELMSGKVDIAGELVRWREGLTVEQIDVLLEQDVRAYERAVNSCVRTVLSQEQFDSLVSFCFNVGPSAFCESTLVRRLNAGQYEDVPAQLRKWIYAAGETYDGLARRREVEIERWNA